MRNSLLTDNSLALDVLTGNDETIDFEDILRGKLFPLIDSINMNYMITNPDHSPNADPSSMPDLLDIDSPFSMRA
jgi:hypothetical protein